MISIKGYDHLGKTKIEGIRYAWHSDRVVNLVESAAFKTRTKLGGEPICAYTTSVSAGCLLRSQGRPCVFCRTGKVLPFGGLLTYREIAKQNVFMVLSDMYYDDHPELAERPREFAYMGQGEPGYSYSQVRMAIELTNQVMSKLNQTVYRHIFATSGVPESIKALKDDITHYYTERVTLHLSLHAGDFRDRLMPINGIYPIQEVIAQANGLSKITGEKTCVGILLFWNYVSHDNGTPYSTTIETLAPLLDMLTPEEYRLSFCEFNPSPEIGKADVYPEKEAYKLLDYASKRHFEAKLFFSFGRDELTACGMLGGKTPEKDASVKWQELDSMAEQLINESI